MFKNIPAEIIAFADPDAPISPIQLKYEFEQLIQEVKQIHPINIVEIGSLTWGTLYQWMKITDFQVISIDLPNSKFGADIPDTQFVEWYKWATELDVRFNFIKADSHDPNTIIELQKLLIRPIDFLFIDGDHTYEGAKQDFETYGPLVKKGGIIALHDILIQASFPDAQVHKLWQEIRVNGYKIKELYQNVEQTGMGIGIIYIE